MATRSRALCLAGAQRTGKAFWGNEQGLGALHCGCGPILGSANARSELGYLGMGIEFETSCKAQGNFLDVNVSIAINKSFFWNPGYGGKRRKNWRARPLERFPAVSFQSDGTGDSAADYGISCRAERTTQQAHFRDCWDGQGAQTIVVHSPTCAITAGCELVVTRDITAERTSAAKPLLKFDALGANHRRYPILFFLSC